MKKDLGYKPITPPFKKATTFPSEIKITTKKPTVMKKIRGVLDKALAAKRKEF